MKKKKGMQTMGDIVSAFLDKSPPWFFIISSIILIVILIIIGVFVYIAVKRFADNANKENKVIKLLEERETLKNENLHNKLLTEQLTVAISNAKTFVDLLVLIQKNRSGSTGDDVLHAINKILEGLTAVIKTDIGEMHRCGFWINDDTGLRLLCGSSGFPLDYPGNRVLDINHSIAGRCFRKSESINIVDVTKDADWKESDSSNTYSSLICIPISEWGVVTIDAKREMSDNTLQIGQLYCSIISGILGEYYELVQDEDIGDQNLDRDFDDFVDEVAANVES
ncbi:GAF domain-containing protein [Bacillus paralicheniformis]|uniref:GAF domain-containing protein n=2 Tax=Bacillaceae TaxID=186817 RepID=UPI000E43E2B4|nr:GAF domain-containing protein [Bacillus paralicheniformis]RZV63813.1 GAF domain-containing protein [Bacillus paralicheniformis]